MSALEEQAIEQNYSAPSLWLVLRVWFSLGLQSFGGGAATLFLIRRAVVEQHHWLTDEEFTRDWAISQVTPGINLLCITILIGWRTAGVMGIALSLVGLLFPSVSITVLLTALYAGVQQLNAVQAILRGVVPATVGLGLLLSWQNARPLVVESHREGRAPLLVALGVLVGSGLIIWLWNAPVILVLCFAGLVSALFQWWFDRHAAEAQP